jgi:heptosyltransferase-2
MGKNKVLIIKTGYSEVLDERGNSRKVSLGDILRTTCLLHLYKKDRVTWVTDQYAFPLLEENQFIENLLPYDFTTALQLKYEEFDTVINLEKVPGICALADQIHAWKKYGFRFNRREGYAEAYDKAFDVLAVSSDPILKKENKKTAQELLFEMVGSKWNGEEYILGYKPKTKENYDIGLNTIIGQKWPTKAWPKEKWDKLEGELVNGGYSVTRQDKQSKEILEDLNKYIEWINSSNTIVSTDSLGLHLGIVLKKKVIGLFGPTPSSEVYFYGRGRALLPLPTPSCLPCFNGQCEKDKRCIENISAENVCNEIRSS